jgi:hypothetical protein
MALQGMGWRMGIIRRRGLAKGGNQRMGMGIIRAMRTARVRRDRCGMARQGYVRFFETLTLTLTDPPFRPPDQRQHSPPPTQESGTLQTGTPYREDTGHTTYQQPHGTTITRHRVPSRTMLDRRSFRQVGQHIISHSTPYQQTCRHRDWHRRNHSRFRRRRHSRVRERMPVHLRVMTRMGIT